MSQKMELPNDLQACHALLEQQTVQLEQQTVQLEQQTVQLEQQTVQLEQQTVQLEQQTVQLEQQTVQLEQQTALIDQQHEINEELAAANEKLKVEIEELKRYIYGRRSERHCVDRSQGLLFDDLREVGSSDSSDDEVTEEEVSYRRKRRRRNRTDHLPEHLPREVKTLDVPESERRCPCCGDEMPVIDTDVRERLEFIPARLVVQELRYPKRACGKCQQGVAVAAPPAADESGASLTPGSRYGFGVTAQIILGKYADHLPLYRLEDVFARAGVTIARSTQVGLLDAAADLIHPLTDFMKSLLMKSRVLGLDDTPVRLQDPSLPGKMRTARMWLARGPDSTPYNVFFFHKSRERDGPARFLSDYSGWVSVDAYGVQGGVYLNSGGRIRASCCHAHARRKFEAAKGNDPRRAAHALSVYQQLYDIEDRLRESSAEARQAIREQESVPLLSEFETWLKEQRDNEQVLPKSSIGQAVRYALNQWEPLIAFATDGELPIDNNATERDLRRLTIGRKNWLFIGSEPAGEVAARLYTLIASASRHDLDHWAYLNDVLRRLSAGDRDYESMLPDRWGASHPESIRTYRQAERVRRRLRKKSRRARRRKLAR